MDENKILSFPKTPKIKNSWFVIQATVGDELVHYANTEFTTSTKTIKFYDRFSAEFILNQLNIQGHVLEITE